MKRLKFRLLPACQKRSALTFKLKELAAIAASSARANEAVLWSSAVVACAALAWFWDRRAPPTEARSTASATTRATTGAEIPESRSADTMIPSGFVLVPIQVANYESLDSILGQSGVVDLFSPSPSGRGHAQRIAERLRILRSPLDASKFAVLAPASEAHRLVVHEGSFFVAVQNPKRVGAAFEVETQPKAESRPAERTRPSRIHIESSGDL